MDTTNTLQAVLEAARGLLGARECDMITAEEWDLLEEAVAGAGFSPATECTSSFEVQDDEVLVHRLTPKEGGQARVHECFLSDLVAVAVAAAEFGDKPFLVEEVRDRACLRWPPAAAAIAFLLHRGRVTDVGDRHYRIVPGLPEGFARGDAEALRAGKGA